MGVVLVAIVIVNVACAHETEYPEPYIVNPSVNEVVSGDVDFNVSIEDHHETLYMNVTATNKDTKVVYFHEQDSNPNDGWSCRWDTSDAPNGKYFIDVVAINSANLKGQYSILITLNNTKKDTYIVLDANMGVVNQSNTIMAHLLDSDKKPLSGKNVEFDIDGKKFITQTTSEGAALVTFTPDETKVYDLKVKFIGDNIYGESSLNSALTILANSTVVRISEITANTKEEVLLKANLKRFNGSVSAKEIKFYINGEMVGSGITDNNGDAEIKYLVKESGGKYVYVAEYAEDAISYRALSTMYVPESSLYLRISATTYSKDGIFTIGNNLKVLYTIFNNGLDNASDVLFRLNVPNSLKYISSSTSKGNTTYNPKTKEFRWDVGEVGLANESVEIEFKATGSAKNNLAPTLSTSTYDKSVNNKITRNTIVVKSYKLVSKNLVKYYTASDKFRVYVKDTDGKVVSGAVITITFNKDKFSLKTNAHGYIELDTTRLKVGKYTIKATCNCLSKSYKITVKSLILSKDIASKKAKSTKFAVKIVNKKGNAVVNKKVMFKIDGKKYSTKTNKKGFATIVLKNLKVGKHTILTYYGLLKVKNTIAVKK